MTWVLRRFVLAPAAIALTVVIWVTLPVWLLVAAALAPVLPGRWRPLRVLWMLIVYLTAESLRLWPVTDRIKADIASQCAQYSRVDVTVGAEMELLGPVLLCIELTEEDHQEASELFGLFRAHRLANPKLIEDG